MRKLDALFIDGDASSRNKIQKLLEQAGMSVKVTDSGHEGLELAQQSTL